jgi:eukaryotic-like serine/threonine-protein kinase
VSASSGSRQELKASFASRIEAHKDGGSPGTRIGPYEIADSLGAGGMGEVYRARDTKLKRTVASKVVLEGFSQDPERGARLEREAEELATLNHPHIAAIHGVEESNSIQALVLELVEGPTLADRLLEGPLPVEEALAIARRIAEALEAAHAHGMSIATSSRRTSKCGRTGLP